MIKLATIGTSWITEAFLLGCQLLKNKFKLTAVYSRDYQKGLKFGSKFGCEKVICNLEELANDPTIEAVYIASPNAFHYSQSKLMLEHKKHVICEKPITVTPKELEELLALSKQNGVVYMEALIARHLPAWNIMQDTIKHLGRISHARFDFSQRSTKYDGYVKGEHQNIFDPKMCTGALMDLGIYCIYPALGWFGDVNIVYSFCRKLSTGADGEGGAVLHFSDLTAELTWSKTGETRIGSEIIGENGTIVLPSISKMTNIKLILKDGTVETLTDEPDKPTLMSYEANDFYRYITDYQNYKADLDSANELALKVSQLMFKIRKQSGIEF